MTHSASVTKAIKVAKCLERGSKTRCHLNGMPSKYELKGKLVGYRAGKITTYRKQKGKAEQNT